MFSGGAAVPSSSLQSILQRAKAVNSRAFLLSENNKYLSDFQLLWKTGPAEAGVLPSAYPPVKANAGSRPEFSALKEAKKPINISGETPLPKEDSLISRPKPPAVGGLEARPPFSAVRKSVIFEETIPDLLSKGRTVEQAPLAKHPARVIQPEPSGGIASKPTIPQTKKMSRSIFYKFPPISPASGGWP